jgi:hypothetical protein
MVNPRGYTPDLGLHAGRGELSRIPLANCKGRPLETINDHGLIRPAPRALCPIHQCMSRMTDWKPGQGLNQALHEFYCWIGKHAFYKELPHKELL